MKSSGCSSSSSSSFHEQLSCVVELKAKFSPWVTLCKLFLPHVVATVFLRAACCRESGWSIKVQNSAFKDVAWLKKWVWERFTTSWCFMTAAIQPESAIQSPANFFLGHRRNSVQGVRVCDWSSGWRVLSVWKLLRNQGGEMRVTWCETEPFSAEQTWGLQRGCLGRPGDTRTCCRSDRWTQGSRDFSRGEKSDREIKAGLGWEYQGLGTEVIEMVKLWARFEWWAWREGGREEKEI